jgi:hypothetical protein
MLITRFGTAAQREHLEAQERQEAFNIEHARNTMMHALVFGGVKGVQECFPKMLNQLDESGHYNLFHYVADDATRAMVAEFQKEFV